LQAAEFDYSLSPKTKRYFALILQKYAGIFLHSFNPLLFFKQSLCNLSIFTCKKGRGIAAS